MPKREYREKGGTHKSSRKSDSKRKGETKTQSSICVVAKGIRRFIPETRRRGRRRIPHMRQLVNLEVDTDSSYWNKPHGTLLYHFNRKTSDWHKLGTCGQVIFRSRRPAESVSMLGVEGSQQQTQTEQQQQKEQTEKEEIDKEVISKTSKLSKDEYADKMKQLCDLFHQIKFAVDESREELDEFEDVLGEVEIATLNIEKILGGCQLIWRLENFTQKFVDARDGEAATLYSPSFETHSHGYRLMLSLCPYGDGKGYGEYMSIFFCLLKGRWDSLLPWPFRCRVTFTLMNQADQESVYDIAARFTPNPIRQNAVFLGKPTNQRNPSLGLPRFVKHEDIWSSNNEFIKDDTLFIKVEVDTSEISSV